MAITPKHFGEGPSSFYNIILNDNGNVERWEEAPARINKSILKNFPKLVEHGIGVGNVNPKRLDAAGYHHYDLLNNHVTAKVDDIIVWLNQNIGRYKYITVPGLGRVWFRNHSDIMLFALRWQNVDK